MSELAQFQGSNDFWGDRLPVKDFMNKPAIVFVHEVREGLTTSFNENGDGRAVLVDVADLTDGKIYINVAWWTGAIVDGLKKYIGQPTAIKFLPQQGSKGVYPKPAALEGTELQYATSWWANNESHVKQLRARREQEEDGKNYSGVQDAPALPTLGGPPAAVVPPAAPAPAPAPATPAPAPVAPTGPLGDNPADQAAIAALIASYQAQQQAQK